MVLDVCLLSFRAALSVRILSGPPLGGFLAGLRAGRPAGVGLRSRAGAGVGGAGEARGEGLALPPVLHAGMGAVAQAQGQKAPVGGVPGLPPVPPDVVPGKVAAGAAIHVIPFLI